MTEKIGNVTLDTTWYRGEDLYSDGDVEDELLEIVKNSSPADYNRIIGERNSWPVLYHLSHLRGNILRQYPMSGTENVLEVGAGCGAVTGTVAEKAGSVTCIDLSKRRCLINAWRNKDRENLHIYVGNFEDIESHLPDTYDIVTLIGVFEYAAYYLHSGHPYDDFLERVLAHVRPGGHLLIAIENRLGLKYFAGCREDHLGRLYTGIEGYAPEDRVRTFSRREWQELLAAHGLERYTFYYPWPDYKLPTSIFSDSFLPAAGELTDTRRNFDQDRLETFREDLVWDSILREGLFSSFSNSFLIDVEKDAQPADTKLLYTRYSDERDPAYSVYTQIFEVENGARSVRKCAETPEAAAHLRHIRGAYEALTELYADTSLSVNRCDLRDTGRYLELEYISGETLEERFDRLLLQEGPEAVKAALHAFAEEAVPRQKLAPFVHTEEFVKVFGEQKLFSDTWQSLPVSDIDLICSNIVCTDSGRQIIDYEWTFSFPVPADFLVFRIVHYYVTGSVLRRELNTDTVFEEFGINEEEKRVFQEMEYAFQKSVQGRCVPLRSLYSRISPGTKNVVELAGDKDALAGQKALQVFFRKEGIFAEPLSYRMSGSRIDAEILVPDGADLIRLDPGDLPCICRIEFLAFDGRPESAAGWQTNGKRIGTDTILFGAEDPQVLVPVRGPRPKLLSVSLIIYDAPAAALGELSGRYRGGGELREKLQKVRRAVTRR